MSADVWWIQVLRRSHPKEGVQLAKKRLTAHFHRRPFCCIAQGREWGPSITDTLDLTGNEIVEIFPDAFNGLDELEVALTLQTPLIQSALQHSVSKTVRSASDM